MTPTVLELYSPDTYIDEETPGDFDWNEPDPVLRQMEDDNAAIGAALAKPRGPAIPRALLLERRFHGEPAPPAGDQVPPWSSLPLTGFHRAAQLRMPVGQGFAEMYRAVPRGPVDRSRIQIPSDRMRLDLRVVRMAVGSWCLPAPGGVFYIGGCVREPEDRWSMGFGRGGPEGSASHSTRYDQMIVLMLGDGAQIKYREEHAIAMYRPGGPYEDQRIVNKTSRASGYSHARERVYLYLCVGTRHRVHSA